MFQFISFILLLLLIFVSILYFKLKNKIKTNTEKLGNLYKKFADRDFENKSDSESNFYEIFEKLLFLSNKRLSLIDKSIIENRIKSKEELSLTLERIVNKVHSLLNCKSVELALYNRESGVYNTSLLSGKPPAVEAQSLLTAELSNTKELEKFNIFIEEISFSSSVIGSLRVALHDNQKLVVSDKEALRILAMQAGLAIINAEYASQLLKLNKLAEEGLKARTGFLANLSHEVRGPLGIILNAVELVIEGLCGELNEEQKETLEMVKGNSEHLLDLINDVLDFAKVESGNLKTNPEKINLKEVLEDLSEVVRGQAHKKKQVISLELPKEDLSILCDKRHFRQMLINLLTNAIKYTQDLGNITLGYESINIDEVKVFVKDTGIGIPESEKPKVFAVFERVDNEYANSQVGTGLGMPLTKKLSTINGAQIDFESVSGEGSNFHITFKKETRDLKEDLDNINKDINSVKANGEKIVFLDDSEEVFLYSKYLINMGFNVEVKNDLDSTLDLIKTDSFDLILISSSYLGKDTQEVFGKVKNFDHKLPIIVLTNKAFEFDIEFFIKFGAALCLATPVHLNFIAKSCLEIIKKNKS